MPGEMIFMQRQLILAILCFAAFFSYGCSRENQQPENKTPKVISPHGAGTLSEASGPAQGFTGIVKSLKLPPSETKTIGAVFDEYRYFDSREWKESRNADGKVYVDFKGLFKSTLSVNSIKDGVTRQGVGVKFVVAQNGDFYVGMVSRIDVMPDGKMYLYPMGDGNRIIELIYANKEIVF